MGLQHHHAQSCRERDRPDPTFERAIIHCRVDVCEHEHQSNAQMLDSLERAHLTLEMCLHAHEETECYTRMGEVTCPKSYPPPMALGFPLDVPTSDAGREAAVHVLA